MAIGPAAIRAVNALGAVGYSSIAAEIAGQVHDLSIRRSALVHCTGTAGTQAGLVVGIANCLPEVCVVGIDIDAEPQCVRLDVVKYAREAAALLEVPFPEDRIEVVAGYAGPGYGIPHQATIDSIRLVARLEALLLDPVYAGKGLAGLIALIRQGRWRQSEDAIFIHTGATPSLFAYRQMLDV